MISPENFFLLLGNVEFAFGFMTGAFKEHGFSCQININSITECISNSFITESLLHIHSINNRTDEYKWKWLNHINIRESDRLLNLTFKHKLKGLGNISRIILIIATEAP
jgi:hypothetical protein